MWAVVLSRNCLCDASYSRPGGGGVMLTYYTWQVFQIYSKNFWFKLGSRWTSLAKTGRMVEKTEFCLTGGSVYICQPVSKICEGTLRTSVSWMWQGHLSVGSSPGPLFYFNFTFFCTFFLTYNHLWSGGLEIGYLCSLWIIIVIYCYKKEIRNLTIM